MPAYGTIAAALAARYDPALLPATPASAVAIRSSSAAWPNAVGATPCLLVTAQRAALDGGGEGAAAGGRRSTATFLVRLYYDQLGAGNLERDSLAILDWISLLADQLKGAVQLGGLAGVARAVVTGWTMGILGYAGTDYTGAELQVTVVSTEAWAAVS